MDDERFEQLLIKLGENQVQTKQSIFERHAQTVLVGLITLTIAWVGVSIQHLVDEASIGASDRKLMKYQIEQLTAKWDEAANSHVSIRDFNAWKARIEIRINELEAFEKAELSQP